MTELTAPSIATARRRVFGIRFRPITLRRWAAFKANRRGYVSAILFLVLFGLSLPAEIIANDRPIVIFHNGGLYFPVFKDYPETAFGGTFATSASYKDPYVQQLIDEKGWAIWPLVPFD